MGTGTELCGHASGCTAMTDPASTGPPLVQGKRCAPLTGGEAEAWRRGLFRAAGLPSCFTQGSVTQGLFLSQRLPTCQGNLGKDPSSGRKWPDLLRQDSESTPPKCTPPARLTAAPMRTWRPPALRPAAQHLRLPGGRSLSPSPVSFWYPLAPQSSSLWCALGRCGARQLPLSIPQVRGYMSLQGEGYCLPKPGTDWT